MIQNFKHCLLVVYLCLSCGVAARAADAVVPLWKDLSAPQQQVLAPLSAEWNGYTVRGRKRLIALADRYPRLNPEEQARVAARLKAWASLSIQERDKARENFRKIRKLPPEKQAEVKRKLQAERDALKKPDALKREAHEHIAKRPVAPAPAVAPQVPPAPTVLPDNGTPQAAQ